MGVGRTTRNGLLVVTLAGALLVVLLPVRADAAVIGARQLGNQQFGASCGGAACTLLQTRIPGSPTKAPFTGWVRRWRVATPGSYEFQLVVARNKGGGRWKAARASDVEGTPGSGVHAFKTKLRIRKNDRIGISTSGSINGRVDTAARHKDFRPPLTAGAQASAPIATSSGHEYLYNATIRR